MGCAERGWLRGTELLPSPCQAPPAGHPLGQAAPWRGVTWPCPRRLRGLGHGGWPRAVQQAMACAAMARAAKSVGFTAFGEGCGLIARFWFLLVPSCPRGSRVLCNGKAPSEAS